MTSRAPLEWRLLTFDLLLLGLLTAAAVSPLGDAYDGSRWILAAALGALVGVGSVLLGRTARWGPLPTALLLVVGYLLVGPAAVSIDGNPLPTGSAERTLTSGTIDGWRAALTLPTPLGSDFAVLIVPLVITTAGGALAAMFLWRSRWPGLVCLPIVAMFAAAATFGTRATHVPLARGAAIAIVLLVWIRWRSLRAVRTSWIRRIAMTGALVAVAGIACWGASTATAGDSTREVLRDHVTPPLHQLNFKSPLSKYRNYYSHQKNTPLFDISGDGVAGDIRLATMDRFNGIVWNVATTHGNHGTSAFERAPSVDSGRHATVKIEKYTGPWVPTVGRALGVSLTDHTGPPDQRQLLYSPASTSIAQYGNVRTDDVYRVDWAPLRPSSDVPPDASIDSSVTIKPWSKDIPQLDRLAQVWIQKAGASSPLDTAKAIEEGFHDEGFYSDGLQNQPNSPSGHGAKRIIDLVATPDRMIGNAEQYASAMGVVLQHLGLPARVVIGFASKGTGTVTGSQVTAWVELPFKGYGWVGFKPTPPKNRTPTKLSKDPVPRPQPNVVQPPVLPTQPQDVQGTAPTGAGKGAHHGLWAIILGVLKVMWSAIKLLLLLSPIWGLILAKRLRRRRRRAAEDPLLRVSGGWREVVDRARDLGTPLPPSETRYEHSVALAERFPEAELAPLATIADRHVFGPAVPSAEDVDAYWTDVDSALKRMRSGVPLWRRALSVISPASIPWRHLRNSATARSMSMARLAAHTRVGRWTVGRIDRARRAFEARRLSQKESE